MRNLRLFPVLVLVLCASAANAQMVPERAYLRVGIGQAQWQANCDGTSLCDGRDIAAQVGMGYRVSDRLAVEAALVDFGSLRLADSVLDVKVQGQGLLVGAAWHLDLPHSLTASLRGGVAQIEANQRVTSASGTTSSTRTRSEPYLGASVGFRMSPQITLELAGLLTHLHQEQQGLDLQRGRVGLVTLGVRASF